MARPRGSTGGGGGGGGPAVAGGVVGQVVLDTSQVDPAIAELNAKLSRVAEDMRTAGTSATASGKGMASFGSSMMTAAAFADDLQYGMRAVVNQIPMVTTALGMGAGLGGAVAIAAVAVNQLNQRWDTLVSVFSTRGPETAAQEMARLASATEKSADEQERLNELKREEQQIEEQKARRSPEGKALQERAGEAINNAPGDALRRSVRDALMREQGPSIEADVQKRIAEIESRLGLRALGRTLTDEAARNVRDQVTGQRQQIANTQADQIVRGAEFGSGAEQRRIEEMARRNPESAALRRAASGFQRPERGFAPVVDAHVQAWREGGAGRDDLEAAYAQGEAEARAEEGRREALRQSEVAFQQRADEVGAGLDVYMDENKRNMDRVEEERESSRTYAEGMAGINQRYQELLRGPVRVSQSMSADQYEASIKAHTGETEEVRQLKEMKELQKQALQLWRDFKPIGVIRRGGGG